MAAPKSLTLPLSIDVAERKHKCQHSRSHIIFRGDKRLKVKVGRTYEHYCISCAQKFISNAIQRLEVLSRELDETSKAKSA